MKWFGLAALFGCNSQENITSQGNVASGPFEIVWEVYESRSGAWFNNGGNPNAKQYTSWFSVKYQGQVVKVPAFDRHWGSVQEGTELDPPIEKFWQALFLKDAPQPAIIVGMHSMHLITEENGQLRVTPLHEQDGDFATYQWLDSDNGQPGEPQRVYLGDDSDSSRFLSGGRYLLVNSEIVLDVHTLEIFPFDLSPSGKSKGRLDDYNATNHSVVQFSPLGTQMVLVGHRFNPTNRMLSQYGLVVVDFRKNQSYAVGFDRTDTRFFSIWDATPNWLNTYFEWKKEESGEEQLVPHTFKQLPYWQGRWAYDEQSGDLVQYKLMPVQDAMMPVFLDFIRKEVAVKSEKTEQIPHYEVGSSEVPSCYLVTTTLQLEDGDLSVYLYPPDQSVTLNSANRALVKQIGEHFNAALAKGEFQAYFGRYE
ncbi:MAG: hypothetical protein ABIQ93_08820 [Saprospiraceae bacterium]